MYVAAKCYKQCVMHSLFVCVASFAAEARVRSQATPCRIDRAEEQGCLLVVTRQSSVTGALNLGIYSVVK
jgi:hypothetical protein